MGDVAVLGIDGGGTATRALVLDDQGRELGRGTAAAALADWLGAPVEIEALLAAAQSAAKDAKVSLPVAGLCAGLAGVGRERERALVESALAARGLAANTRVVTDAEAAFFSAFGEGPGILVMAGTGSIAWGRGEDGREARVGGWGSLIGDEGSGYDIGLGALRAAARAANGRGEETELLTRVGAALGISEPEELISWAADAAKADVAALAPTVCELAETGDRVAAAIVRAAVASLRGHVAALLTRLGPWGALPGLAVGGGLLAPGGPLRDQLIAELAHYPCVPLPAMVVEPALGAAQLALRELRARG
ncbi:MAG: BadF/BadG/BcrA/BcrD type ATPase [Gemmatimonadota bacterium]|nr:MAG: BadF/BadG/BcrA/BcrD type ATPase [Gemmatimonadota bacterium]